MRLVEFEVEGFRSIKSLKLSGLGPHAVFYGPNGAGKSNILAAVDRFFACLRFAFHSDVGVALAGSTAAVRLDPGDYNHNAATGVIRLKGRVEFAQADVEVPGAPYVEAEFEIGGAGDGTFVTLVRAAGATETGAPLDVDRRRDAPDPPPRKRGNFLISQTVARSAIGQKLRANTLLPIPALRGALGKSVRLDATDPTERAVALAMAGCFEEAVFVAHTSPDLELLQRLERLRALLAGPPLNRPPFRPVRDEARGVYAIQEIINSGGAPHGVPLDLAGLGVQQIYAIVAAIMLSKAPIVTLEEPEAHLYERGTGLDLRHLLMRLVPEPVSQLFTATHSSIFDLDPTGYWDVSHSEERGTMAEWNPNLADLDQKHVYEPGGARHALQVALRDGEPDRVVARRPDGTAVVASEMVRMLVDDDPVAIEFLNDVTSAAVRLVAQRANRKL